MAMCRGCIARDNLLQRAQARVVELEAKLEQAKNGASAARDRADTLGRERDRLREALEELTAMVRGECPSLLNEDSGGDATLALRIDAALAPKEVE